MSHGASSLTRRAAMTGGLSLGLAALAADVVDASESPLARGEGQMPLITKPIPQTGERLPVIGLAAGTFDQRLNNSADATRALLNALIARQGKLIDTGLTGGKSEQLIGTALAAIGARDRVFLAARIAGSDAQAVKASIDESFRNLRTDRIDLLQLQDLSAIDTLFPELEKLKRAGRVRYVGAVSASAADNDRMLAVMRKHALDFVQINYSMRDRSAAEQLLPLAQERRIGVIANSPFGGSGFSVYSHIRDRDLPDWAAGLDIVSWRQFFLKYVVSHPAVTCCIPGILDVERMDLELQAARGRLPDPAIRKRMEELWEAGAEQPGRPGAHPRTGVTAFAPTTVVQGLTRQRTTRPLRT
jgi:aryl-alcohol dehydrogenase-like predicted oxidoreductase